METNSLTIRSADRVSDDIDDIPDGVENTYVLASDLQCNVLRTKTEKPAQLWNSGRKS